MRARLFGRGRIRGHRRRAGGAGGDLPPAGRRARVSGGVDRHGDAVVGPQHDRVRLVDEEHVDEVLDPDILRRQAREAGHSLDEEIAALVIHGVFEVKTSQMGDERSKILKEFLTRSKQVGFDPAQAAKDAQAQKTVAQPQQELLVEPKVAIPLQNMEKQD